MDLRGVLGAERRTSVLRGVVDMPDSVGQRAAELWQRTSSMKGVGMSNGEVRVQWSDIVAGIGCIVLLVEVLLMMALATP